MVCCVDSQCNDKRNSCKCKFAVWLECDECDQKHKQHDKSDSQTNDPYELFKIQATNEFTDHQSDY